MNLLEEAIVYSTVMHAGEVRKGSKTPYILHPLEVAQIASTMTEDIEVITACVLHDVVEDTDGTLEEIKKRFGERVASLVDSETENKYKTLDAADTWKRRKEETLFKLKNSTDIGVKILWLSDKLSNIRSLHQLYSEKGNAAWQLFHQKDPDMHRWYYKSVAEEVELYLNRTGAFKELIGHINFIWPGTFEKEKTRYKKFRSISPNDLSYIGRGAKSMVYRYNDELIVKVYNSNNTFKDIEKENSIARKAFVAGIPTAIPFGIVRVGENYGSMFELLSSETISSQVKKDSQNVAYYAKEMANLAKLVHSTSGIDLDVPDFTYEVHNWIDGGLGLCETDLAQKMTDLVNALPKVTTLIHGDLHSWNVIINNGEYMLIDLDRLSTCHPIVELSGIYMFYVGFGELDPSAIEDFMGFSYAIAKEFFEYFLQYYLEDKNDNEIADIKNKAALLCYTRLVRRCYKKGLQLSPENEAARDYYLDKIRNLLTHVETLDF